MGLLILFGLGKLRFQCPAKLINGGLVQSLRAKRIAEYKLQTQPQSKERYNESVIPSNGRLNNKSLEIPVIPSDVISHHRHLPLNHIPLLVRLCLEKSSKQYEWKDDSIKRMETVFLFHFSIMLIITLTLI
ncbi:hypothetical protein CDAR_598581 [Caerostris darwini]|uniref:Uncharacterized protein n=1 Tax=Caerostris darwini TaxID=1538125 RepID=A0AAV4QU53_9ARAC|nr:hypothetical protein CDAR_598581 [Caerostris darwini]